MIVMRSAHLEYRPLIDVNGLMAMAAVRWGKIVRSDVTTARYEERGGSSEVQSKAGALQ